MTLLIIRRIFFIVTLMAWAACATASEEAGPLVKIHSGYIQGKLESGCPDCPSDSTARIASFKGIPYARPPIGKRRWSPPVDVKWYGIKQTVEYGASCIQPKSPFSEPNQDEDCLFINVWTKWKKDELRPVMVWIHGGGYTVGSGSKGLYDGRSLASKDVVVVTFNYRLGPFGFFAHRGQKEDPENPRGNYGLMDQIFALQWVKRNIESFGGDPNRVTIFGESAGGGSVGYLVFSNQLEGRFKTAGLFHRAIAQSGHALSNTRHIKEWRDTGEPSDIPMESIGDKLALALCCSTSGDNASEEDVFACMQGKPAREVLEKARPAIGLIPGKGKIRYWPIVDEQIITDQPIDLLEKGTHHRVPLLLGSNANETTLFGPPPFKKPWAYRYSFLPFLFGVYAERVFDLLPVETEEEVPAAYDKVVTLSAFTMPARFFARKHAEFDEDAYVYEFIRVSPGLNERGKGATHGAEIAYVFKNLKLYMELRDKPKFFDQVDEKLADAMSTYWVQFASDGDPNAWDSSNPFWPSYAGDTDEKQIFGDTVGTEAERWKVECDLFELAKGFREEQEKENGSIGN
jgi:para-nitrobenzyl esterase